MGNLLLAPMRNKTELRIETGQGGPVKPSRAPNEARRSVSTAASPPFSIGKWLRWRWSMLDVARSAGGLGWLLPALLLAACQTTTNKQTTASPPPKVTTASAPNPPPPVRPSTNTSSRLPGGKLAVSPSYDAELRRIIDLANHNQWTEAESRASALYALDPKDSSVQRVYNWVRKEGPKQREKALEDEIRDVTASQDERFNPTVKGILTEKKSHGLPPRSDLRDAIEKIKATPYIPETFGKTIQSKGALEDFRSEKGQMEAILDKRIEVHLDNVPLESIVFNVGQQEGISLIVDRSIPAFQQKLTANFKDVKLRDFLNYVQRNLGVSFQVGSDLIWIVDGKDTNKIQHETRFFRLRKGLILPAQFGSTDPTRTSVSANNVTTVTETQKYDNFVPDGAAKEPALIVAIKNFCEGVQYYIDYERNLLMAQGTTEQLDRLEKLVDEFDKPVQQVLIEARFVTVTAAAFLQLGALWQTDANPLTATALPADNTGLGPPNTGLGLQETWTPAIGRRNLSATLTALDQSGESETLSAPKITLLNNLPATITDATVQFYYEEYSISQQTTLYAAGASVAPSGKPTQLEAGVTLDVLASIGGDGKSIMLALRPKVTSKVQLVTFATVSDHDSQGQVSSTFDIRLPQSTEQSLSTRVVVKTGQTVVMGGVIQRTQTTFTEAVPVLSRIPILGAAFRRRTEVDQPRYLLIFVTATLLSENGELIVSSEAE
jgi:type IV pilus assembly protein PilQ